MLAIDPIRDATDWGMEGWRDGGTDDDDAWGQYQCRIIGQLSMPVGWGEAPDVV